MQAAEIFRSPNSKLYSILVLGPWSDWSECSLTCGGGHRLRERECGLPAREGDTDIDNPCLEPLMEREECNTNKCPIFTEWSPW